MHQDTKKQNRYQTKKASTVAEALQNIYKRSPLTWPNLLQVDPGKEYFGDVVKLLNKNNVKIRRGIPDVHRQQALVERFNRTLAERLFSHEYENCTMMLDRASGLKDYLML